MNTRFRFSLNVFLVGLAIAASCTTPSLAAGSVIAVVTGIAGHVDIERAGASSYTPAALEVGLFAGDTVKAEGDGEADILFTDGAQIKLSHGSAIKIDSSFGLVKQKSFVQAIIGVIWAHLRPGQTISAPSANIVVRGTEVAVEVQPDGTTKVTVLEGGVSFYNSLGEVDLTDNEQSTAEPGKAPTAPISVDPTGLVSWTANVIGLPLDYETPQSATLPKTVPGLLANEQSLSTATESDPTDVSNWINLGQVERALGNSGAAITAYTTAVKIAPSNIDARVGLALTELSQGAAPAALSTLQPIQHSPSAESAIGLIDLETGQDADAEIRFHSALAADNSLFSARALLGLAQLSRNDIKDAELSANDAWKSAHNSVLCEGILSTVLLFEGNNGAALKFAKLAMQSNSRSPFALLVVGRNDMERGDCYLASVQFERALSINPRLWLIHQELAASYLQLGLPDKAAEEFRIAISLDPLSAKAHAGLAESFHAEGNCISALSEFKTAVALDPNDPSIRYYYATLDITLGQLDSALDQINSVRAKLPTFGLLYSKLAEIYLYKQDVSQAEIVAREGVKVLPNSAIAHFELGRVYYEEQHTYQAEEQFRIATTLDPRLSQARYALGLVQEKTGSGLLTSFSSIFDSAYIGSPASSQDISNLNTPGANQRLQAEIEDPTSIRAASGSYGNTELDAVEGGSQDDNEAISTLSGTTNPKGVVGITGDHQYDHGVRANDDTTLNKANFVLGESTNDNKGSGVLLGDYEQSSFSLNDGINSSPLLADGRYNYQLLRLTGGLKVKTGAYGHLLAVVQGLHDLDGTRPNVPDSDPNYYQSHQDAESLDAEVRWDEDLGRYNELTVGGSYGELRSNTNSFFNIVTPPLIHVAVFSQISPVQVYARDTVKASKALTIISQVQYIKESPTAYDPAIVGAADSPYNFPATSLNIHKSYVLPYFVAAYQIDPSTLLRFRYQRLGVTLESFQLLNPDDDFLISYDNLPQATNISAQSISEGTSDELEIDHSFHNASFVAVGLFHEHLLGAANENALTYDSETNQGLQASYQTRISSTVSASSQLQISFARDNLLNQSVAQIPPYDGIITIQYLNNRGYYDQLAWYEQGPEKSSDRNSNNPGVASAFGIINLRFGKRLGLRTNLFAELNNLTAQRYSIFGEIKPGREFRLGVSDRY